METLNMPPLDETALRALIQKPESHWLEFKSNILSYSEIAEYVVGIGNAGGGFLIMGVTNKAPRQIVGVAEMSADDLQQIRRSVYGSTSVRIEPETVSTSEGFVLAVRIPPRPAGVVFHTRDGKYLTRAGEDLVGMTVAQVQAILNEPHGESETPDALPISIQFLTTQHSMNHSLYVVNHSEVEIRPVEILLEKDGFKLADPAKKEWPGIAPHGAATLNWQPNGNPLRFITIKWQERLAGKELPPSYSSMEEIDVIVTFVLSGGRRVKHRERIMANVDHRNHTWSQWL